jgi:hypothetical protein
VSALPTAWLGSAASGTGQKIDFRATFRAVFKWSGDAIFCKASVHARSQVFNPSNCLIGGLPT